MKSVRGRDKVVVAHQAKIGHLVPYLEIQWPGHVPPSPGKYYPAWEVDFLTPQFPTTHAVRGMSVTSVYTDTVDWVERHPFCKSSFTSNPKRFFFRRPLGTRANLGWSPENRPVKQNSNMTNQLLHAHISRDGSLEFRVRYHKWHSNDSIQQQCLTPSARHAHRRCVFVGYVTVFQLALIPVVRRYSS